MAILELKDVSIRYMTGDFKDIGLKEYVMRRIKGNYRVQEFWADRDISFALEKGDMLGIIGTNGAGKSTLLKAISGIMEPTRGWVHREGTIAALLELGSGFDAELTGRENIFLNGAILGYSEAFLLEKYDEIVDFSELGGFIETPIRNYSSGMLARLAFSIATVVKPEILIVDEILSVGDAAFQEKSRKRMMELMGGGTTVLFVSHSIEQIREMCGQVVWLKQGKIQMVGKAGDVCDGYEGG